MIPIPFSVSPLLNSVAHQVLSLSSFPDQWFERELLKKFNFVLDTEADALFQENPVTFSYSRSEFKHTQFVHRSGVAIIQIKPKGQGFLWTNNRLHLTSINTSAPRSSGVNADAIRQDLYDFCQDRARLGAFWEEVAHQISSVTSISELPDDVVSNVVDGSAFPVVQ